MLAYYWIQQLGRKMDQDVSFKQFVGEKVVFPSFPLKHPLKRL
jgi:hypothetical protein